MKNNKNIFFTKENDYKNKSKEKKILKAEYNC